MRRLAVLAAALALIAVPAARNYAQKPEIDQSKGAANQDRETKRKASFQFYSMQAAIFAALAHGEALERITGMTGEPDFVVARTLISTSGREIQGAVTSSIALGKAVNSLEKTDSMKMMRDQLHEALNSMDEAQAAADGHGTIHPKAKSAAASLTRALEASVLLADDIGIEAMSAPGTDAIEDAKRGGLSPDQAPRGKKPERTGSGR